MKVGVLFSGGKDSSYALFRAMAKEEVACLISVMSENKESYMFHTPNIELVKLQSEAAEMPLVYKKTKGVKEEELSDLREAIINAKERYGIEGIVTGAVESVYQASRIQKICSELGIRCFNPLWKRDQREILHDIISLGFEVIITGVFAGHMGEEWLGRRIDEETAKELFLLEEKYGISPTGEGGEIETTVLDAPFFRKKIAIEKTEKHFDSMSGIMRIKKAFLEGKRHFSIPKIPERKLDGDILLIDMNERKNSLSYEEFVLPVAKVLKYNCFVRHWSEVSEHDLSRCKKVVLSGSPLGDTTSAESPEKFSWLKGFEKPVLGICSGHHALAVIFGGKLVENERMGMNKIRVKEKNKILPHDIEAYELHKYAIEKPKDFVVIAESKNCIEAIKHEKREIYGVQFHPEVRNTAVIERFFLV